MSRSTGVPDQHPDDDLLADLAAEVLPVDLAERVQQHVMGCDRCAALLADAEGIRLLLRQSEPETMPYQVWARLERAMASAQSVDQPDPFPTTSLSRTDPDATAAIGLTGAIGGSGSQRGGRRAARSSGPATSSIGMTGPLPSGPPTSRLSRMSRPAQSARRQAIEEQKADHSSPLSRFGRRSQLTTAAVVLLGIGAFVIYNNGGLPHSSSGQADSTAAAPAAVGPLLPPVQSTSTNYSRAQLVSQVKNLLTTSQQLIASGDSTAADSTEKSARQSAGGAAKPAPLHATAKSYAAAASPATSTPVQPGQLLRSPAALQACLNEIGADQQPVAIDLARYAGQEAAIIVLPAPGGGYQVEVVARDCRPGNDGTIDVVTLKNP